jgi:tRNA-specific 2-thiouridylase
VAYRDEVANYFISEYKAGRTPNPDVLCNKEVKFGAFMQFAKERGADFIATGHYVERKDSHRGPELHRGIDTNKDQSYFLWALTNEQLAYSLFPVGSSPKDIIRKEAASAGIPTAMKKDSQGVCFLGHVDIPEFLSHYIDLVAGDVLNEQGVIIGTHQSSLVYTIGQRHGFTIFSNDTNRSQLYVVAKDAVKNTITVSPEFPTTKNSSHITLVNTIFRSPLTVGTTYVAQFRYRQTPFTIKIISTKSNSVVIEVIDSVEQPAIGQSCVIYDGSKCIGGGIIS